jgi:hypothetical protein
VTLHGVRLNLHSEHAPLVEYAREHLGGRLPEEGGCGLATAPLAHADLEVRCLWSEGPRDDGGNRFPAGDPAEAPLERIGKRILGSPDTLVWLDPQRMLGLQLRVRRRERGWAFDVAYRYHPGEKHRGDLQEYEYKKYFSLMSWLVYYPVFWHLERTRGFTLIHAASLSTGMGAVMVGGLGGVGKTTLSMALSREPGFTLGAENLSLTDGETVLPCHEPIRMDPHSLELLGAMPALHPMRFPAGLKEKHMFHVRPADDGQPWAPRALFLPHFTDRHVIRLLPGEAAERFLAMNRLTLEVDDYAWFASALDLHWPSPGLTARRTTAVETLARRAACFDLGVDPTAGVAAAVADVLGSLD